MNKQNFPIWLLERKLELQDEYLDALHSDQITRANTLRAKLNLIVEIIGRYKNEEWIYFKFPFN